MNERTYGLQLSEEQLIFFTEMLVDGYCSALRIQLSEDMRGRHCFVAQLLEATLREHARNLLREPLRDSRFREELTKHFSEHSNPGVREFGWKWIQEVLVWEI